MIKVMSGHAICMSKIETCMKCMSKRLVVQHAGGCLRQRGGLFALRVTRRGHLEAWRLRGFEPKIEDWTGRYLDKLRILERLEDCCCNWYWYWYCSLFAVCCPLLYYFHFYSCQCFMNNSNVLTRFNSTRGKGRRSLQSCFEGTPAPELDDNGWVKSMSSGHWKSGIRYWGIGNSGADIKSLRSGENWSEIGSKSISRWTPSKTMKNRWKSRKIIEDYRKSVKLY